MLPDTGIDDVKKQRNAEYAKHINDPVLSSLKMEGIRLLFQRAFSTVTLFAFNVSFLSAHLSYVSSLSSFHCPNGAT
jgi:hypothetical protein